MEHDIYINLFKLGCVLNFAKNNFYSHICVGTDTRNHNIGNPWKGFWICGSSVLYCLPMGPLFTGIFYLIQVVLIRKVPFVTKRSFVLLYSFLLDDNISLCFPGSSLIKNLPTNARDTGSIPGLRRTPGEGKGNPFHNYCLGNPTDRWAWRATVQIGHKTVRHNLVTKQQQQLRFLYSSTKICITYFICKICI